MTNKSIATELVQKMRLVKFKTLLLYILLLCTITFTACESKELPENTTLPTTENTVSINLSGNQPQTTAENTLETQPPTPTPFVEPSPPTPTPFVEPSPRSYDNLPINAPDENGVVWIIEPSFEYEEIKHCTCGYFDYVDFADRLSVETILAESAHDDSVVWLCWGHGFSTDMYFFDEKRGVFAIYCISEGYDSIDLFTPEEFVNTRRYNQIGDGEATYKTGLYAVRKIDIEEIDVYESFRDEVLTYGFFEKDVEEQRVGYVEYNLEKACTGKYALAYGDKFLTDFIYDYNPKGNRYFSSEEMLELKLNEN